MWTQPLYTHAKCGSNIFKAEKVIHQIDENVNVNNNTKGETIQLQKNIPMIWGCPNNGEKKKFRSR
jgi:hypothetical protein